MEEKDLIVSKSTTQKRNFEFSYFLIIATLSFTFLTFFAKQNEYFKFDLAITQFIQRYNEFWFDLLMKFLTFLGNLGTVTIIVFFTCSIGFLLHKKHAALVLFLSTFGGLTLSEAVKYFVSRPRPDPELISVASSGSAAINQIGQFIRTDSFPSGHVMGAISLYGFILYLTFIHLKKNPFRVVLIGICGVTILLMGLSRIYLGAHWFSDVLGAYLLGFIWLSFVVFLYHKLEVR